MLEPNAAVTQLPAVYGFGYSNYIPFQVTAFFMGKTSYSGWEYLQKHKCMRSSRLRTHSFPIELTRLCVTLTPHGFTVSVNTSARPMKSCTCRKAPFARWFHSENTWSNDAQNTIWIWWFFGFGEHSILSSLQLLSLSLSIYSLHFLHVCFATCSLQLLFSSLYCISACFLDVVLIG